MSSGESAVLNNIFQDSLNEILSQPLTHDRSYIYKSAKNSLQGCCQNISNVKTADPSNHCNYL